MFRITRPRTLEQTFPGLRGADYRISSPEAAAYNCVAWAFEDDTQWWEYVSQPEPGIYWPPDAPCGESTDAYVDLFAGRGYTRCDTAEYEDGHEKVAIYVHAAKGFGHVAWQNVDGVWWSKLGKSFDIEHARLDVLEGDQWNGYGRATIFMRRSRRTTRASPW